jgi:hypothetical protein
MRGEALCAYTMYTVVFKHVNLDFQMSAVFVPNSFLDYISLTVVLTPLIWNPTSHTNKIPFCIAVRLF